jgi:hypothetical protein
MRNAYKNGISKPGRKSTLGKSKLNWEDSIKVDRDISVGIALNYELDDRGSSVRFPEGAGNFSLYHCIQNGTGAHPASYPIGTGGSFSGGKAAGA